MNRPNLVLIHGWGLNEEVWSHLLEPLSDHYQVHTLSLPGYGKYHRDTMPDSLGALAERLLEQAPDSAIWCGWSLGGMAAMAALLSAPERVQALKLLCVTPRFTNGNDWQSGTDINTFKKFSDDLTADYARGLRRFLLLQAGSFDHSRTLAKQASLDISKHPAPSEGTLITGLNILKSADLRDQLSNIKTPCQIIAGQRDRVVPPAASRYLAEQLPQADYVELNSGHAPMLSHPQDLLSLLLPKTNTRKRQQK